MKKPLAENTSDSLAQLDKLLEHRSRLGACVLLADTDAMTFTSLKKLPKETDGNMDAHMRKMDRDEEDSAREAFEKALEIDPNNGWVKYELLPKVEKEN